MICQPHKITMMKYIFSSLFIFILTSFGLIAQITITSESFPGPGDRYTYMTDTSTGGYISVPSNLPQMWNYDTLSGNQSRVDSFEPIDTIVPGFDDANLIFRSNGFDTYLQVTEDRIISLGNSINLFGVSFPLPSQPDPVLFMTPTTHGDVLNTLGSSVLPIAIDSIPFIDSIIQSLVPPDIEIDSIRFRITTNVSRGYGAYGTLTIPGRTDEVLRSDQEVITQTALELHAAGFFPVWVNPAFFGFELPGFGIDTARSSSFWAADFTFPLMTFFFDDTGMIESAEFISSVQTDIVELSAFEDVSVFPNPTSDYIQIHGLDFVRYSLHFFDLDGKLLGNHDQLRNGDVVELPVESSDVLIYRIFSEDRRVVQAGKIIVGR